MAYRSAGERARVGRDFFAEGLVSDEMLVYVADGDPRDDPLAGWLEATVPPDRLTLSQVADIYPSDGRFDGPGTVERFRELAASARAGGCSTLRAMADLTRLAVDPATADDLLRYELLIDDAIHDEGLHGLCTYDRHGVGARVPALTAAHPPLHDHNARPTVSVRGDVLRLHGELDLLGVDGIGDVLAHAPHDVGVVSLDGLAFLDATGGRALWAFATERARAGSPVAFEGASRTVQAVLDVYGIPA